MKKKIGIICACAVCVLLIGALAVAFFFSHTWVGGQLVHNQAEGLDLSGKPLSQMENLAKLQNLKNLNLEGTQISIAQYQLIQSWLPQCRIQWLVPFQGQYLSPNTQSLTLTQLSAEDVAALDFFADLRQVDAAGCRDYEALRLLQERHPQCRITYQVLVSGQDLPQDTRVLKVSCESAQEVAAAIENLSQLQSLTVTGCRDSLALKALADANPQLDFTYDVYFGDRHFPSDSRTVTLDAAQIDQVEQLLPCMRRVQHVTILGQAPTEALHALAAQYPDVAFHYSFDLCGKTVHTDDSELDLSGIPMENTQELEASLPYFHRLTSVDMLDCGIANEDMAALNQRHPGVKFVWSVLLAGVPFRTDITYFYPTGIGLYVYDEGLVNLKYCTDIVCLDLGHFGLSDCSFVEYMPKLQYLVLGIGSIQDVRPIGTLKELRFLELFLTDVTDYWPLINCTNLETLNLSYSGHGDITPLLQMPWLDHLWLCQHYTTYAEKQLLAEHLPNTIMVFQSDSSTDKGWRNGPNYYAMRDILGGGYMTV